MPSKPWLILREVLVRPSSPTIKSTAIFTISLEFHAIVVRKNQLCGPISHAGFLLYFYYAILSAK